MENEVTALSLPDADTFKRELEAINGFQNIVRANMKDGQDFGIIPGTTKPTLLKPGAEKITKLLGLADKYEIASEIEDWVKPLFYYKVKCTLISVKTDVIITEGFGSCNSMESKYRYRESKRTCPVCGRETIIKGKDEYGGGWICFTKKGGCGAKWPDGAEVIEKQTIGQVENDDIFSIVNTILKMAEKRCLGSTTPVLVKTQRGICRMNLSQLYDSFNASKEGLSLPGINGGWRRIEAMTRDENREILKITLSDGSAIRATREHRFPTSQGLKEAGLIQLGDILIRSSINLDGSSKAIDDYGWISGMFLSQGSFLSENQDTVRFTLNSNKTGLIERIQSIAEPFGGTVSTKPRRNEDATDVNIYSYALAGIIHQFLDGDNAYNKHLSRFAWRQSKSFLFSLLHGYLDGDGYYQERQGRNPEWSLGFNGENYELVEDLRSLASILDYRIKIIRSTASARGKTFPIFKGWLKPKVESYNQLNLETVENIEIESKLGVVYDIQVDGDHLFCLANGIQSHNSLVDAALHAGRLSEVFTQDIEDMPMGNSVVDSVPEKARDVTPSAKPIQAPVAQEKAPPPSGEGKDKGKTKQRDLTTLKTITDMQKAVHTNFGLQPNDQLKELNISKWSELTITPIEAYQQIAATRQ